MLWQSIVTTLLVVDGIASHAVEAARRAYTFGGFKKPNMMLTEMVVLVLR